MTCSSQKLQPFQGASKFDCELYRSKIFTLTLTLITSADAEWTPFWIFWIFYCISLLFYLFWFLLSFIFHSIWSLSDLHLFPSKTSDHVVLVEIILGRPRKQKPWKNVAFKGLLLCWCSKACHQTKAWHSKITKFHFRAQFSLKKHISTNSFEFE